ncbi:MAG: hypothetical protein FJ398_11440 [Verrucomicrobia bacterium]|nr:hypothetical protein [Verrucomicrobiota bacterium]
MKTKTTKLLAAIAIVLGASLGPSSCAQEAKPKEAPAPSSEKAKSGPDELEARFKATLTKATLSGRWCSIKDGQPGPDKEDKYTILSVTKLTASTWLISARIQYGKVDVVAPIPVQVRWAGDTPVIIVDNVGIPGGNKYSARVMIYDKTYSGTWTGGDHGGLLHGVITNEKE